MTNADNIISDGQSMYFDDKITKLFVDRERDYQNNKEHIGTSKIFESIIIYFSKKDGIKNAKIANLGAGATSDEFDKLIEMIPEKGLDRVDKAPIMIELAKKYSKNIDQQYQNRFNFVNLDSIDYLQEAQDNSLDFIFMQYTFNLIYDIKSFFELVKKKLKKGGYFIADINLYLKGVKPESTNAICGINGEFLEDLYYPKDGDIINVHFKKAVNSRETLCSMNIVYHSKESIISALAGLFEEHFLDMRTDYEGLEKNFMLDKFNASLQFSKDKPYLIIKNI